MIEWTKWDGGECPVEEGVLVDVRYRDGEEQFSVPAQVNRSGSDRDAAYTFWRNDGQFNDIVAYRLSEPVKVAPEIDSEGWIIYDGKSCPVDDSVVVDVLLYGEREEDFDEDHVCAARFWGWNWYSDYSSAGDIVKWRIHKEDNKDNTEEKPSTVKSDGGSSGYYKITIKNELGEEFHCETNDVLYALVGGDFDMSNIIKACRRMYEASQGRGKQGTDIAYDVKKIKYFADDFAKRFGNA